MDLILWRHAEAFEASDDGDDLDRALTPKGERQAKKMAAWLGQHLPSSTKVLASPARRTQQTAQALDRKFKTVAALAPDGTVDGLLAAVRWPDAREPVLVVGHQPTLGLVAACLMAGVTRPWSVRKGAVWWLRSRQRAPEHDVVLVTVRSPDNV
jgi:phosphohistidine phosphatase